MFGFSQTIIVGLLLLQVALAFPIPSEMQAGTVEKRPDDHAEKLYPKYTCFGPSPSGCPHPGHGG
ncbi:hypothetical protein MJO28_003011 [Puccinia striiformis f. sp. tritici]|uniref:Uncharacterized protein n=1 Tax=Puccinia striiformis f. sp. tritici TaxID=168172 RepID=A0ACC0ETN0_9BASI|nr:hypothetical protein MJO28_003011 [Puccinia striiformis f. sp. tritici]